MASKHILAFVYTKEHDLCELPEPQTKEFMFSPESFDYGICILGLVIW